MEKLHFSFHFFIMIYIIIIIIIIIIILGGGVKGRTIGNFHPFIKDVENSRLNETKRTHLITFIFFYG